MMNCNGSIEEDEHDKTKEIIQISGDHRKEIEQFLINEGIVLDKANLKIHGH
jgi:translation initiation factor 1 (eIF-1/SUI1)